MNALQRIHKQDATIIYRGAFILIPVALFLLPIGGIWAIVDIVRRKGKPEKK
jgi:hypothetical protein